MLHSLRLISMLVIMAACSSPQTKDETTGLDLWHGIEREHRYHPEGKDFVITNGTRRFNRALYGGYSDFRVEAGDLPEFALYLPGLGGTMKVGFQSAKGAKWLINADSIEARYRRGAMIYTIKDALLGKGHVHLTLLAPQDVEGMVLKAEQVNMPDDVALVFAYGGATGKRFNRDGDIGADPESVFYLTPAHCEGNQFDWAGSSGFQLHFGENNSQKLFGRFSNKMTFQVADANQLDEIGELLHSQGTSQPVLAAKTAEPKIYCGIFQTDKPGKIGDLATIFDKAEQQRQSIADNITLATPDPYINTLGGALAIAAEAIWQHPSYQHGAVAWRMPLVGWRGAYTADCLGNHERAKTHFKAYAASQYTEPELGGNYPDTSKNLARQLEKRGYSIFTKGYISRRPGKINKPHHYDMNQVYIDQLLRHFDWTGDKEWLRDMWPLIERHLAWEKHNFDPDNDGLYNAYASIWASDALEYNGGGVAYSSAYNYYANRRAYELANRMGKDGSAYREESQKIKRAMDSLLWLPGPGHYAEYKDMLGNELVHKSPGVWSIYHTVDSEVPGAFRAYQALNYIKHDIPHIPIQAKGMPEGNYEIISTTNWMPYTWSVNNVALAEQLHTSLAFWQGNRPEEAFHLWKSALMESMYLGASPGNFQQLAFYDAMRGELYRDFADAIGVASRTLVEGLFGIQPDMLNNHLLIAPGFPQDWPHAHLATLDFYIDYQQQGTAETYRVSTRLKAETVTFQLTAQRANVKSILVNGKETQDFSYLDSLVGAPKIAIEVPNTDTIKLQVNWAGDTLYDQVKEINAVAGKSLNLSGQISAVHDPQDMLSSTSSGNVQVKSKPKGHHTFFGLIHQGDFTWWEPIDVHIRPALAIAYRKQQPPNEIVFNLVNRSDRAITGNLWLNNAKVPGKMDLSANSRETISFNKSQGIVPGSNVLAFKSQSGESIQETVMNWNVSHSNKQKTYDLSPYFNDRVTQVFENDYLRPRSPYPTVQIPIQGLGDWCSFDAYMKIDDSGLRKLASGNDQFTIPQGIAFTTPSDTGTSNVIFTSLWDNYPDSIELPVKAQAAHAYFLMTGTTNPMQSRMENGRIIMHYKDGSLDTLSLRNPENWWPIEQDYYLDDYAFNIHAPKPLRIHLKTGWMGYDFDSYTNIGHFTEYAIEGGAATVLDMPLDINKQVDKMTLEATANDVVIGLMSMTFTN